MTDEQPSPKPPDPAPPPDERPPASPSPFTPPPLQEIGKSLNPPRRNTNDE